LPFERYQTVTVRVLARQDPDRSIFSRNCYPAVRSRCCGKDLLAFLIIDLQRKIASFFRLEDRSVAALLFERYQTLTVCILARQDPDRPFLSRHCYPAVRPGCCGKDLLAFLITDLQRKVTSIFPLHDPILAALLFERYQTVTVCSLARHDSDLPILS